MTVARVDLETGEILAADMTRDEARQLTDRINDRAAELSDLIYEAHTGGAWRALGYHTWADYVRAEVNNMSRSRSYQLLDLGRITREIEAAVSTKVDIGERAARQIKPRLGEVTDDIRDRIADEPSRPSPERTREIVAEVIDDHRDQIADARRERDANDAWIRDTNARAPEGFDPAANSERLRLVGALRRNTTDIAALPAPQLVVAGLMGHQFDIDEPVHAALDWLTRFSDELAIRSSR